jgi:hypothetical protein
MSAEIQLKILRRIFDSHRAKLSSAAARSLMELDFSDDDRSRMNHLAALARSGELTKAEDAELEDFLYVGNLLALIHAKARRSMKKTPAAR